jgi:hypothetical protein
MGLREMFSKLFGREEEPLSPEEMQELAEAQQIREQMTDDRLSQRGYAGQIYRSGEDRSERDQRY